MGTVVKTTLTMINRPDLCIKESLPSREVINHLVNQWEKVILGRLVNWERQGKKSARKDNILEVNVVLNSH